MVRWGFLALAACIPVAVPMGGLRAQDIGASVGLGSLGFGGRFAVSLGEQVNVRGGIDVLPFDIEIEASDVVYDLDLATPSLSAVLDWHPGGSGFRLSGGAVYFANEMELNGTPLTPVEIGEEEYQPSEIGTLIGTFGTSQFAPYVGIGWGNSTALGVSFQLDLGVAIHGTPDVNIRATGPIGDDPTFIADLEEEVQEINDEVERVTVYPVLTLGVGFGL